MWQKVKQTLGQERSRRCGKSEADVVAKGKQTDAVAKVKQTDAVAKVKQTDAVAKVKQTLWQK